MKNNALKSRKMAFVFVMIGALLIFPSIGERAAAEEGSGTVVEVLDENGQIVEMGDGDAQVVLEDPALIENDPEETPDSAGEPEVTPDPTDEPEVTPDPTDEPEVTPDPTNEPEVTPDPTDEPEVTPDPTDEPEVTPDPTDEPEVTPDPTDEPEVTPDPTDEPEVTPDPTDAPEITPLPTVEPTSEPTPLPTIAPELTASFQIQIVVPSGWSRKDSEKAKVTIQDEGGTGFEKVEVRLAGGEWIDITASAGSGAEAAVDVTRNGLLVVRITDPKGEYHREQAEITCFDRHAPTVTAGVQNEMLHVETTDTQSGVAGIQVNGLLFTTLENGKLDVKIMELLKDYKKLAVRAYDYVGNFSDTVNLDNPYYEEPAPAATPKPTKKPSGSGSSNKATATPKPTSTPKPTVTPNVTAVPTVVPTLMPTAVATAVPTMAPMPTSTPTVVTEYITLGPGMPYKSGGNMQTLDMLYSAATNKQFITVQTKSGETYYLVIDYDKPIDEEAEIYETYFLNLVDNRDLLAVLADDEKPTPTPVPTPTPTPIPTVTPTAVPTEPNTGNVNAASMLSLMLLGLIGGGAAVWFAMSRKNGSKQKNLSDEYMFEDDEDTSEEE